MNQHIYWGEFIVPFLSGSEREQKGNCSVSSPVRGTCTWRISGADTEQFPFRIDFKELLNKFFMKGFFINKNPYLCKVSHAEAF